MVTRAVRVIRQAAMVAVLLSVPLFLAADHRTAQTKPHGSVKSEGVEWQSVQMFAAMEAGDIEVKLIAKSDAEAQIRIKNKTDRPLSVQLPETFAGVPVL